ncbi:hypothetical protein NGA_2088000, partial [Nannochloropsis gaditana CCMP526]|uniref:uncharacterized protein n=1 Tax=Nannochloropsis gaditana (strain CCMP526) TaxID=1093141 RepID=UPI00029F61A9
MTPMSMPSSFKNRHHHLPSLRTRPLRNHGRRTLHAGVRLVRATVFRPTCVHACQIFLPVAHQHRHARAPESRFQIGERKGGR